MNEYLEELPAFIFENEPVEIAIKEEIQGAGQALEQEVETEFENKEDEVKDQEVKEEQDKAVKPDNLKKVEEQFYEP